LVWEEIHDSVMVSNGMFNVLLGSMNSLGPQHFSGERYLEIKIGGEVEMEPRMRLTSVAYSLRAEQANRANHALKANHALQADSALQAEYSANSDKVDNKDAADFVHVKGDTMTGSLLYSDTEQDITKGTDEHLTLIPDGSGMVGIGTANPGASLEIKNTDDDSLALNITNSGDSTIFSVNSEGAVNIKNLVDQNIAANGYAQVGSLIIQWGGYVSNTDNAQVVNFPKAFPNACFSVMADRSITQTYTKTSFSVDRFNTVDGSPTHHFIAIGF